MTKTGEARKLKRKGGTKGVRAASLTLVDKIADELRVRIIDGTFQAGEHLQQAALAKRMGVSSIPLREAVRMLENEGFVEILPFKGARVKSLTCEEIVERAQIAFALESHAVALTRPTLTEEDFDRAAELAGRIYPVPDVKTWYARVNQLLGILCGAGRWPLLFDTILRNRMTARRYTEILVRRTMSDKSWARNWAKGYFPRLVELLKKGNMAGARALQRRRFEEYAGHVQSFLEEGAGQGRRGGVLRNVKHPKAERGRS